MAATSGVPVKSTSAVLALGTMLVLLSGSHALSQPRFTKVPVDQIGVSGGVVSLVCQATGDPNPHVNWTKNGNVVSSQRIEIIEFDDGAGSVLRIQPLRAPRDESNYECVAETSEGQVTATARVSVIRAEDLPAGFPSIDMGPQLKVVEQTRTATMFCAASGDPNPDTTWFKDFLPIDIEASNGHIKLLPSGALQIENSDNSDMGKYECVASNVRGVRYSSPAHLYVRGAHGVREEPRFVTARAGESVILGCDVSPPLDGQQPPYVVEWFKFGVPIPFFINFRFYPPHVDPEYTGRASLHGKASLQIDPVRSEDQGWYECRVLMLEQQYDTFHNGSWVHLTVNDKQLNHGTP